MAEVRRRARIPDAEWEDHKESIKKLYIDERRRLESESGVINLMRDQYGFHASKAQYETRFKKWRFRKYLKKEEWMSIGKVYDRRRRDGISSKVYFFGELIPDEKVQKETARYRYDSASDADMHDLLPDGITIFDETYEDTPPTDDLSSHTQATVIADAGLALTRISPSTMRLSSQNDCFSLDISTVRTRGILSHLPSPIPSLYNGDCESTEFDIFHKEACASRSVEFALSRPRSRSRSFTSRNGYFSTLDLGTMGATEIDYHLTTLIPDNEGLGFAEFGMFNQSMENLVFNPANTPVPLPQDTSSFVQDLSSPLASSLQRTGGWELDIVRACTRQARPLFSMNVQKSLQTKGSVELMVSLIIHLLMNNFVGSDDMAFDALFRRLRDFSIPQAQILLRSIPLPYSKALQQSILTLAIEFNAIAIVRTLLNQGLNMDQVQCQHKGLSYSPIALSCKKRRTKIVQMIIESGAKVNMDWAPVALDALLEPLYESSKYYEDIIPQSVYEIFELLLKAGVNVLSSKLQFSKFWKDINLVDTFITHTKTPQKPKNMEACLRILKVANGSLDSTRAFQVTLIFLGCDFKVRTGLALHLTEMLREVLAMASFHGHDQVIEFLIEANVPLTSSCLVAAVQGNRVNIVHRFLKAGISPNSVCFQYEIVGRRSRVIELPDDIELLFLEGGDIPEPPYTTAFAEAIRWQRSDLIVIFQNMGSLRSLSEQQRGLDTPAFFAPLDAAIEAGDLTMFETFLGFHNMPVTFSQANQLCGSMCKAILGGHEDIFLQGLLGAGYKPDSSVVSAAIIMRNTTALRLCLDIGVPMNWYNGHGLVWLAVRWGNVDAVRDLIEAGASFTDFVSCPSLINSSKPRETHPTTPLGEAIKRKDRMMVQELVNLGAEFDVPSKIRLMPVRARRRETFEINIAEFEIATNTKIPPGSHSPLTIAVQSGGYHLVQELLSLGADPNDPVALLASARTAPQMSGLILKAFDQRYPDGKRHIGNEALRHAIRIENIDLVRLYAEYSDLNSPEPDATGETTLNYLSRILSLLGEAIVRGNLEIIEVILRCGGNPNSTVTLDATQRRTALLEAIQTQNLTIVEMMCKEGANVNHPATLGILRTPLQLAVEIGHIGIVQFLLGHGADVNADPCIFGGGTALQLAAIKGYVGLAELLIKNGADVNAPRGRFLGRTAFEGAAEHGRMDMLLFLYHNGVNLASNGGEQIWRAMELATWNGQLAAKSLVEQISQSVTTDFFIT